jgi:RluA family pseudouridine synthase
MDEPVKSEVLENFNGERLDVYLATRFTYMSRAKWQSEIKLGKLTRNGQILKSAHARVTGGDIISYEGTGKEEPPVNTNYSVVYEDEYLMAVNKPPNLPVHPSGCFFKNTLMEILSRDKHKRFYPIHRIDRETSGLLLFSCVKQAISKFQKALAEGAKTYLVLVYGHPKKNEFTVSTPLGVARNSLIRKKREAYPEAKESALTHFTKIAEAGELSLLKAIIETGRTHQIRAHCLYAGLPVAGDKIYGLDEKCYLDFIKNGMSENITSRLGFHRSALHCSSIRLIHPFTGKELLLEVPLAGDMEELLRSARASS